MNGLQVFPFSPVSLAMGLHKVAVGHSGLVDYGPWNVFLIYGGPEENSCPGESSGRAQAPWALLNCSHWVCLKERRKVLTLSMSLGCEGLLGCMIVLLCRISQGEGMLGLIGVDLRSSSTVSRAFLAGRVLFSTVIMVLFWCSMKPLDLGKVGRMWSSLCSDVLRTLQAPQTGRAGCCP